jgi:hypothetical protein
MLRLAIAGNFLIRRHIQKLPFNRPCDWQVLGLQSHSSASVPQGAHPADVPVDGQTVHAPLTVTQQKLAGAEIIFPAVLSSYELHQGNLTCSMYYCIG